MLELRAGEWERSGKEDEDEYCTGGDGFGGCDEYVGLILDGSEIGDWRWDGSGWEG